MMYAKFHKVLYAKVLKVLYSRFYKELSSRVLRVFIIVISFRRYIDQYGNICDLSKMDIYIIDD